MFWQDFESDAVQSDQMNSNSTSGLRGTRDRTRLFI